MAATNIYCGTSGAATSVYISNVPDPSAGGATDYVIYLNPNGLPEKWNSKAIGAYDGPGDLNDLILGGNLGGTFTVQNNKIQCTGNPPTTLNNFKKAFQNWSANDDRLYLWEKNTDGYNLAQMYNSAGSLVQIRVKWFQWAVTKKDGKYWWITLYLQRTSPATEI